jgi:hypothetical protein
MTQQRGGSGDAFNRLDKKDIIDTTPAQSHIHPDVRGTYAKALMTREPYGKPGKFDFLFSRSMKHIKEAKHVD